MWSIGCIFAELLQKNNRKPIFIGKNDIDIYKSILNILGKQEVEDIKCGSKFAKKMLQNFGKNPKKEWRNIPYFSKVTDDNAIHLLDQFLQFNPEKRINVLEALKHPYFEELFTETDLISYDPVNFSFDENKSKENQEYIKGENI
jgi:serine/threonine protein kinase